MVSGVVWKVRVVSFSGSRKRERVPEKGASLVNRQRRVFPSQSMKASLFNVPSGVSRRVVVRPVSRSSSRLMNALT